MNLFVLCFIMKINGGTFIPEQIFYISISYFASLDESCGKMEPGEQNRCLEAWNETLHLVRSRQTKDKNFSLAFRRKYEEIETVL